MAFLTPSVLGQPGSDLVIVAGGRFKVTPRETDTAATVGEEQTVMDTKIERVTSGSSPGLEHETGVCICFQ